jgi:hypothetical protein
MNYSSLFLAAIIAGLIMTGTAQAQPYPSNPSDTVYWDPTDSGTETTGGITGDFATSYFYDPTTGTDGTFVSGTNGVGVFTPGEGAIFEGPAGTVAVSAPVSPDYLEVDVASGTETFGTNGANAEITFPQGNGNQDSSPENTPTIAIPQYYNNAINIDAGSENVVFNSKLNFAEFNRYYNYGSTINSSSTGNVAFNGGIVFTNNVSAATADYPTSQGFGEPDLGLSGVTGGTFTINSAITASNSAGAVTNGNMPYVGLETDNVLTLTSNASFSGVNFDIYAGKALDQGATYDDGGPGTEVRQVYVGDTGEYLTDTAGMTVSTGVQFVNGGGIVGSDLAATTTYSGLIIGYSGAAMELTSGAGGRVNFTDDIVNGNGDGIIKIGAGTINVNDTGPDGENQAAFGNTSAGAGGWEIKNGTMLLNGTVAGNNAITGTGVEIDNVTTASLVPNVQTYATLGGNGSTLVPVTADGANSSITPGDPTVNGGIGTLTLNGGLTATSGLTLNFVLDGEGTALGVDSSLLVVPTLSLNGLVTVNFTTLDSVVTDSYYTVIYANNNPNASWTLGNNLSFAFNAPAGYEVEGYKLSKAGDTFSVEFEAVPEPTTWALMGLGAVLVAGAARFRKLQA